MNNRLTKLAMLSVFFLSSLWLHAAVAAERTVCVHLQFRDTRINCAPTSVTDSRRPCRNGELVDAIGHQIELWDKDSGNGSNDDFIGTYYIGSKGRNCFTFSWEAMEYQHGEENPDIYIRYINKVNRVNFINYIHVEARKSDGSEKKFTWWRNGPAGQPDRYVARNCDINTPRCEILPGKPLTFGDDVMDERALRIMALDTAQRALQIFGEGMDTNVHLRFPLIEKCKGACAIGKELISIPENRATSGFAVSHEMGHIIKNQQKIGDTGSVDCSLGGSVHYLTKKEYDSCATNEGWADYVGAVTWYDPNDKNVEPRIYHLDLEDPAIVNTKYTCADNSQLEIQVAKAFWDLDDTNNEGGTGITSAWDDHMSFGTLYIAKGWRNFPDGTGNRQISEADRDGPNMRDFYQNNRNRFGSSTTFFETFIRHNCLSDQDNG